MRALKQATHTRRIGGIILFWCILKSAECFSQDIMAYYSTCVSERQDCLDKLFGVYPVCSDCTQFALCDPNTRLGIIKINCPIYLFYDIRTGSCVLPALAICGSSNRGRLQSPNSAPALNSASRPPAARRPASQERATYQSSTTSLPSQDSDEGVGTPTNIMERPLYSTNAKYATSLLRKSISVNPTSLINPLKKQEKTTFSTTSKLPTDSSDVDTSVYPTFTTSSEIAGRDYSVKNSKVNGDVSGPEDKTNNSRFENNLKDRHDKESNDTTPNDGSLNYRHKYGQGKIAKDSEETFYNSSNNYPNKSPVRLSNLLSLSSKTDILNSTEATHSGTNDPIAFTPSPITTLTTAASVTIATPTTITGTAPSIVTATTPTIKTHFIKRGKCLTSCKGVPDGDYQSCFSCHFYITCSNGFLWDNRPCPSNLVWDDLLQMCGHVSTTCHIQVIRR